MLSHSPNEVVGVSTATQTKGEAKSQRGGGYDTNNNDADDLGRNAEL